MSNPSPPARPPVSRRLPPLTALRAFEASARHLSFTRAAAELHVTQAAISHQIKSLESFLGVRLFHRQNRSLRLTDEGQEYLPSVHKAFDLVAEATRRLLARDARGTLTVSVLPSFAARWLVARLGRFHERWPEISLRIAPSAELVDFSRDDVDVGIRYGNGRYPGLFSCRVLTEDLFPVCSPRLLAEADPPLTEPRDLGRFTLLHDESFGDWRTWLLASGVENVDPALGTIYHDSSMLLQAAVAGQGIAVARGVLAADYLAQGRLVKPFALSLPTDYAYYFVCPRDSADEPKVRTFREWLLAEAKRDDSQPRAADETPPVDA